MHQTNLKVFFADKRTDKERLFDGASSDAQPKTRTVDEIKAKYRKAGVSPNQFDLPKRAFLLLSLTWLGKFSRKPQQ